jgi:hypothetical protein
VEVVLQVRVNAMKPRLPNTAAASAVHFLTDLMFEFWCTVPVSTTYSEMI